MGTRSFCPLVVVFAVYVLLTRCSNGACSIVPEILTTESPLGSSGGTTKHNNTSTLQLVHVVLRHGPRTPVNTYPNDPYIEETFFPYGWGHLTNNGKLELFEIGKNLRKRYRRFLASYYHPDRVHAQSSESPRTLMSLGLVLASLFPPKGTPMEWQPKYNWQPVPIYSTPRKKDRLLAMSEPCPRYEQLHAELLHTPQIREQLQNDSDIYENLTQITGEPVTAPADVSSIYWTLMAELAYGLKMPEWTNDFMPEPMERLTKQYYLLDAYTKEMRRLKGGPFLQRMLKEMQEKASGRLKPEERQMFIYCAHDWSISHILSALDVWPETIPRFSSMAIFELHKNSNTGIYYVEIYFQNDPNAPPKLLTVPGCEAQCPLEQLLELSKDVLPNAPYEEMCAPKLNEAPVSKIIEEP